MIKYSNYLSVRVLKRMDYVRWKTSWLARLLQLVEEREISRNVSSRLNWKALRRPHFPKIISIFKCVLHNYLQLIYPRPYQSRELKLRSLLGLGNGTKFGHASHYCKEVKYLAGPGSLDLTRFHRLLLIIVNI